MEVKMNSACSQCSNISWIAELEAKEEAAKKAGTLIAEGTFECLGLRNYAIRGQAYERCRMTFEPPRVSDPALAQEISQSAPDPRPRPAQ